MKSVKGDATIHAERIRAELLDSFDEELEEEIDDQRLANFSTTPRSTRR